MSFNKEQLKQIKKQIKGHRHKDYKIDLKINEDLILRDFAVNQTVMRPEKMTSLRFAKWLFFNNGLYENKTVIDIGCGTGILGITTGLMGADKVIFSDIYRKATENTKENLKIFNLESKSKVVVGNLFENIQEKADVIIFNHPFFFDVSFEKVLTNSMIDENKGELIHRFLEDAKKYLNENGVIIMPYFKMAGETNDPEVQAPKHGYKVSKRFDFVVKSGLQKGEVIICELRL